MVSLLQGHHHQWQRLAATHIVVPFGARETAVEKGTGIQLFVGGAALEEEAPTPMSEAFASTTNCRVGSGCDRTGAEVNSTLSQEKTASAFSVQVKEQSVDVSSVKEPATLL